MKIPALQVVVYETTNGAEKEVQRQNFTGGPSANTAFLDYKWGPGEWDRVRVRQKTAEGGVYVVSRVTNANQTEMKDGTGGPGEDVFVAHGTGKKFKVHVELLPQAQWTEGARVEFQPPKASISAQDGGYLVTFEPNQYPCTLTVAIGDPTTSAKNEKLPSFPFPSNPRHARGTLFIPRNQFGAKVGEQVRLGIRGAGREFKTELPRAGQRIDVAPEQFAEVAAAQPQHLTEAEVVRKYAEKAKEAQQAKQNGEQPLEVQYG